MTAINPRNSQRTTLRWLKFNVVGAMGIAVQLYTLAALKSGLHLDYTWATALAVEAAIAHNFVCHERFTWPDRASLTCHRSLLRFAKFNLTTGALSIIGNIVLMKIFVETAHVNYLLANLLTIACCSILNFLVSDRLVFSRARV